MDLHLATIDDIIAELRGRDLRFVLVAREVTNSTREDAAWIAGAGVANVDAMQLIRIGRRAIDDPADHHEP